MGTIDVLSPVALGPSQAHPLTPRLATLRGKRLDVLTGIETNLKMSFEEPGDTATPFGGLEGFRLVKLTTSREDDLGEALLRALLAKNYRVRALSRRHPTLEDVFLAATRRSWDAIAPQAHAQ